MSGKGKTTTIINPKNINTFKLTRGRTKVQVNGSVSSDNLIKVTDFEVDNTMSIEVTLTGGHIVYLNYPDTNSAISDFIKLVKEVSGKEMKEEEVRRIYELT